MEYKRREILINKKLQFSITLTFLSLTLVCALVFIAIQLHVFDRLDIFILNNHSEETNKLRMILASLKSLSLYVGVFTTLFIAFAIFLTGMLLSHRIAGPIYRIIQDLKSMDESGKVRNISLREKDYFNELKDAINDFINKFKPSS